MSLINICCDEVVWGPVFPGVCLVQARNVRNDQPYVGDNNVSMFENCFGLTFMNDPFIVFSLQPKKYPGDAYFESGNLTPDEIMQQMQHFRQFDRELRGHAEDMHKLMEALYEHGYEQEDWGSPGFYICDAIARFVETNKIKEVYDRV